MRREEPITVDRDAQDVRTISLVAEPASRVRHAAPAAGGPLPIGHDLNRNAPSGIDRTKIDRIVTRLSASIGPAPFDRYFARQARFGLRDGALEVRVDSEFVADLLQRRFGPQMRQVASEVLDGAGSGGDADPARAPVRFRVERQAGRDAGETPAADPAAARTGPTDAPGVTGTPPHGAPSDAGRHAGRDSARAQARGPRGPRTSLPALRHRLEDFIVGPSNRLAYAAAVRLAEETGGRSFSPLFIHGTCGLGKTHLLQGIARRFADHHPGAVIRYTTAETFTNEFIAAMKTGSTEAFRRSLRRVDLLCLDDVHFLSNKEATQGELLHTFDALDTDGARVVLASDEHPREIKRLREQLVSRFLAGAVARIDPPDDQTRIKLVRQVAARRGLVMDDAAVNLVAERSGRSVGSLGGFGGSVREIEGLVTQVEAVHRLLPEFSAGGVVGLLLVRKALGLGDKGEPSAGTSPGVPTVRRPMHAQTILAEVSRALRVDVGEVMGRGRHPRVVLARAVCAHLSRRLTTQSYPEIARAMNRPNHSTVITACKRLGASIEKGEHPDPRIDLGPELAGLTIAQICDTLAASLRSGAERS